MCKLLQDDIWGYYFLKSKSMQRNLLPLLGILFSILKMSEFHKRQFFLLSCSGCGSPAWLAFLLLPEYKGPLPRRPFTMARLPYTLNSNCPHKIPFQKNFQINFSHQFRQTLAAAPGFWPPASVINKNEWVRWQPFHLRLEFLL